MQWKSVKEDQAAIEQARRELGPNADPKKILARAKQITQENVFSFALLRPAIREVDAGRDEESKNGHSFIRFFSPVRILLFRAGWSAGR